MRVAAALGLEPAEVLDLAASMNPVAPDVGRLVARRAGAVRRYPDPTPATTALASAMDVPSSALLLTNGGAEAIALVAGARPVGWIDEPDFSLYGRHLAELAPGAPSWRSNPHNPTGRLAEPTETADVLDEAFYPLATGEWTRGDHTRGTIVIGSLTKAFACPGLRLGFVLSNDRSLLDELSRSQPRWSVNSLACALLPDLLECADLPGWASQIRTLRAELMSLLLAHDYVAAPSEANFVLVPAALGLRERLAEYGVIVRGCASFGLPDAVRIAVPDERGLERLDAALSGRGPSRLGGGARPVPRSSGSPDPVGSRLVGALLVCGTSSDAGKSHVVTGLCRALARRGVKVTPFKAQNMSLNSFATPGGEEIGRAQGIQAIAARAVPEAAMNPILLKPMGDRRSQVVLMGRPAGEIDAAAYLRERRATLMPTVLSALASLRSRFEVVVCEGAGGAAEINLLDSDLANLRLAADAGLPAIVVGDIERGGVFAALYGTVALLPEDLARTVKGFVINKFRGDPAILGPGLDELERRTGVPTLGVLPFVPGLDLDAEDSLGLEGAFRPAHGAGPAPAPGDVGPTPLDVVVVRFPHLANFTDIDALGLEPGVRLRPVASTAELGEPDVVILPGSKATVADLEWLRETGLAERIAELAHRIGGPTILGVCAGYQMLGRVIVDTVESGAGEVAGLCLLPIETVFEPEKLTRPRHGRSLTHGVTGYEIRHGRVGVLDGADGGHAADGSGPLAELDDEHGAEDEGWISDGGRVAGTSLHGLFESDGFRRAWLSAAALRRGRAFRPGVVCFAEAREAQIDRLADLVEQHLDLGAIFGLIASAGAAR
jgi:adenosylcobyric acid synthase